MCRWLAYSGPPIHLDRLLFEPENSLIRQSLSSQLGRSVTNGDGFGVGWYAGQPFPGQYRDTFPAWNDANLQSLAAQIESGLFFAHVRATTGTATARNNCHPFRHGAWLFLHNGQIGDYLSVRHALDRRIRDDLYAARQGNTDTEVMFLLALANGLEDDPAGAMAATVAEIEQVVRDHGSNAALRMTVAASDGERVIAFSYSTDRASPSLFYITGPSLAERIGRDAAGAVLVLSEPLDEATEDWIEVPDRHMLTARAGEVTLAPFAPATATQ